MNVLQFILWKQYPRMFPTLQKYIQNVESTKKNHTQSAFNISPIIQLHIHAMTTPRIDAISSTKTASALIDWCQLQMQSVSCRMACIYVCCDHTLLQLSCPYGAHIVNPVMHIYIYVYAIRCTVCKHHCCTTNTLAIFSRRRGRWRRRRNRRSRTWSMAQTDDSAWCWRVCGCGALKIRTWHVFVFDSHTACAPAIAMLSSYSYTDDDDLKCVSVVMGNLCVECNSRVCSGHSTLCWSAISLQPHFQEQYAGESPPIIWMSRAYLIINYVGGMQAFHLI